ncbi:MAG: aminoacyl-tRNA hydrolase [Anaerolineae bacterium]|nr:aminoacyl-tRNA hydrolase [Anaerolineae bacterium]NUQ03477.1 aminoacyl-tRNA hydrolase [Anaerolineae bacterium]
MADPFLIVGLGNPGPRYENTRHNVGWLALDRLAKRHGVSLSKVEQKAQTGQGGIGSNRCILAKPMTFMNLSGDAVQPLASFYKIVPERIIVLADDLDIPFGVLRVRKTGSSGGQKGLKHIIERLGTPDVPRVRMGIGRPPGRMDPSDYVLLPFKGDDVITALEMADRAADAVETWLKLGIDAAMNRFNGQGEARSPEKPKSQPEDS